MLSLLGQDINSLLITHKGRFDKALPERVVFADRSTFYATCLLHCLNTACRCLPMLHTGKQTRQYWILSAKRVPPPPFRTFCCLKLSTLLSILHHHIITCKFENLRCKTEPAAWKIYIICTMSRRPVCSTAQYSEASNRPPLHNAEQIKSMRKRKSAHKYEIQVQEDFIGKD